MNNVQNPELAAERQERVRALLEERGSVRVDELARELGVSAATVRRDLHDLEQRGQGRRVHGGAMAIGGRLDEPHFDDKTGMATEAKQRIAAEALRRIQPDESIYLDGGSTVLSLARLLTEMTELTVVTNSLRVAGALSGRGPRLIVVGGELRRRSQTFVGPLTRAVIDGLHVDKAFMGTIGLSLTEGLTTTDPAEAMTKQWVVAHSGQVILLADSGKVGKVAFARAGAVEDLDLLITDRSADKAFVRQVRKRGVDVAMV